MGGGDDASKVLRLRRLPVTLNGKRTNDIDALWTKRASEVSDEDAVAFYRFVGGALDTPAFRLHFSADAPLTIRALLFAPEENPSGVSRRVRSRATRAVSRSTAAAC